MQPSGEEPDLEREIERLRAQHERTRVSELRFRQVAQAMPQLVWTTVAGDRADFINDRWEEYTGLASDAATQGEWLNAVHPDDRAPHRRRLAGGLPQWDRVRNRAPPASP
jgi:PAS domain S-box-containing protein